MIRIGAVTAFVLHSIESFADNPPWRATPLHLPTAGRAGFQLMSPDTTGVTFSNRLALRRGVVNQNLMNGSGVAAGDVDGDGRPDLYFCGLDADNRLYRNRGGWKFEDITAAAGVACPGQDSTGAVLVDLDGDGDLDLLVTGLGAGVRLFINDGQARFEERTDAAGLRSKSGSTSLALADIEGDGDLDLYVANIPRRPVRNELSTSYQIKEIDGERQVVAINGTPISSPELIGRFKVSPNGEVIEYGEIDHFFLNNGNGTFTPLSFTDGRFLDEQGHVLRETPKDWGLAVQFHDWNGDGLPDLYVCNDLFTPDRFWINQGGGRFRAIPQTALRHTSLASMGLDVADINRDGHYDFFVSDMLSRDRELRMTQFAHVPPKMWEDGVIGGRLQFNHNVLLLNRGDMTFAEIAFYGGVAASDWSWGGVFLDVDLDGFEDLLIPTGQQRNLAHGDFATKVQRAQRPGGRITLPEIVKVAEEFPPLYVPKMAFRNRGDLTFEEVGARWGFDTSGAAQGMALADLDNDGDLDLVLNNLSAPAGLYRNETAAPRIAIELTGEGANRGGIGAQIKISGGPVPQQQEMIAGGRYLSGDQARRVFATGTNARVGIEVTWRSGKRSFVPEGLPNYLYQISEAAAQNPSARTQAKEPAPLFEDVSDRLNHTHTEQPFNDLVWQPLLPNRLTRSGPGLTWFDVDRDGRDDLVIPAGSGGSLSIYLNRGEGAFTQMASPLSTAISPIDQSCVLGWPADSGPDLLVLGFSKYKPATSEAAALTFCDLASGRIIPAVSNLDGPVGPIALADVDGDGDLDLFIGTMSKPGHHPEPGSGYLFLSENGSMVLADHWKGLGIIKGAVFADLNADGYPELVLACEWGPLRVLANRQGHFTDATGAWGLAEQTGLWQSVAVGDFNGDGRLDLAAANWGLNSSLQASPSNPQVIYYGDLDGDGMTEVFEVVVDPATKEEFPAANMNLLAQAVPALRSHITSYQAYSQMPLKALLGEMGAKLTRLEVRQLAATVCWNRGDHFEAQPLPAEAQFAPSFGVVAADLDGDGAQDIFLSQNCFVVGMGMTRQDAGRGLMLRGNGLGRFESVPGQQSGLIIYGEQRGCAVSDFDGDGRLDLAVGQNNERTKLFHNRGGIPGVRVRLRGTRGNPDGIGAVLRCGDGQRWGPAEEIHAGSGRWSADSSVAVMARSNQDTYVQVRWPGGATVQRAIGLGIGEVIIDQ